MERGSGAQKCLQEEGCTPERFLFKVEKASSDDNDDVIGDRRLAVIL